MRQRRSHRAALLVAGVLAASLVWPAAGAGAAEELTYSVKEARAYAVKSSVNPAVIENLPECDPQEDPYECDESKYNHKRNCPPKLALGSNEKAPPAAPPKGAEPQSGGSGTHAGPDKAPLQSTPVRLNRFMTLAKLGHIGTLREAGGVSSQIYVDQSGRSEPEAHTESEAFSNRPSLEERCLPEDAENKDDPHEHYLSRSSDELDTYHLAECYQRQCQFGLGINAEKAQTITHLYERGGFLHADVRASVQGLTFPGGSFSVDSMITHVSVVTDGSRGGLRWKVTSTATGAKLGGQPVTLPPGEGVSGPGFTAQLAEPYVDAAEDGSTIVVVAPGLHFGTEEQSMFFGGAELYASASRQEPFDFIGGGGGTNTGGGGSVGGSSGGFGLGGSVTGGGLGGFGSGNVSPAPEDPAQPPVAAGEPGELLVYEMPTGVGTVPTMIGLSAVCALLVLSRWLQRYAWGRKLYRHQPLKGIDWLYRAFVKT